MDKTSSNNVTMDYNWRWLLEFQNWMWWKVKFFGK